MLTIDKVYDARQVLKNVIRKTNVIPAADVSSYNHIYLKPENLQRTGSFKIRGAYYKVSQLSDEEKSHGIIASSAGNHAQGTALAAQEQGIPCVICMPDNAPISKIEATKSYGASVELAQGAYDEAYALACQLAEENGYFFVHPYDDEDVIAGQGTIGLEILEELNNIDAIVCPIGGGGLISGVAFAAKCLKPSIKIYGVQAAKAASMYQSVKEDKQLTLETVNTFADGIAVKHPGDITFQMVKEYVDEIVTVEEDEIAAAILHLLEKQKLIAEGAGAVSVAAVMFDKIPLRDKNIVCIVSGGNIDVNIIDRVITRGLLLSGRKTSFIIQLTDKPGQLENVSHIIAQDGGNVVAVDYDNADPDLGITDCYLKITLETRNKAHLNQIKHDLNANGLHIVKESN
ncbi:threonine ammonia-lyase [Catenisphaera adipataccumulans]|jgi:threonine dehydratase|uniref:L-threonine dehydratase catabolic TdcB n=1 Tax=Catenisphaera adipataccumulans TaxID=700500 RepID=A0A7W8CX47_9FIRM|nr:threonine ammonia-lyase [Catenisphaera adipataccumulans]MBB5183240.1 threonine dehydratase [Catenisphaera adipataccumulans]